MRSFGVRQPQLPLLFRTRVNEHLTLAKESRWDTESGSCGCRTPKASPESLSNSVSQPDFFEDAIPQLEISRIADVPGMRDVDRNDLLNMRRPR